MNAKQELAEKVALAEASVQSVKDPELRRVAFEKVLEKLLSSDDDGEPSGSEPPQHRPKPRSAQSIKKPAKRRGGPKAYVAELIDEGFFSKPKGMGEVQKELGNRGHHIALTSLSGPLQSLCRGRVLRRQQQEVDGKGSKKLYLYSKW